MTSSGVTQFSFASKGFKRRPPRLDTLWVALHHFFLSFSLPGQPALHATIWNLFGRKGRRIRFTSG
jgi:hypothetical protein